MDQQRRPVETTKTSLQLMEVLIEMEGGTLTEIAEKVDYAESTIHRHLVTLCEQELVAKRDDEYRAGLRLFQLGNSERAQRPLYQVGKDFIDQLSNEINKRAWISTYENMSCTPVYRSFSRLSSEFYSPVGQYNHLHVTASGKAILSTMDESKVKEVVRKQGLPAYTQNTITNLDELLNELQSIREQGYAISEGESIEGVQAIAVPVSGGKELGAVGLGHSIDSTYEPLGENFLEPLLEIAGEIELHLRRYHFE